MLGFVTPRRRRLPIRTPSSPRLTQEEIDAINEYPDDTGYTYARSFSYSSRFPREYTNPTVGYRHSLSNSDFIDDRSYFVWARDFVYYLISSVLYLIYSSFYSIASYLIYGAVYFTPLYYVFNSAKIATDITAVIGIVIQFITRVIQISYYCVKDFFLQTGYNSVFLKNDIRKAFWDAFGYRYMHEEKTESEVHFNENFAFRQRPNLNHGKTVSRARRFVNSIIYIATFGYFPAPLVNSGVIPPTRYIHRTSGFGNKGFLVRCALNVFGFIYYIVTAEFLYERLEPVQPVGVQARYRAPILAQDNKKKFKYRFRWRLACAFIGTLLIMLLFGFAHRNSGKRYVISPANAFETVGETHYPSLDLTESLAPTIELAYTKSLDAKDFVVESSSTLLKVSADFWGKFSSGIVNSYGASKSVAKNNTTQIFENVLVWMKYGFGKVIALPRVFLDLVASALRNVFYFLNKAGEFIVNSALTLKNVLLHATFAIFKPFYNLFYHISHKISFGYDSVPSVDTAAIFCKVDRGFSAVIGENGYLSYLFNQFVALLLYIAMQISSAFAYIVLLPYKFFGSQGLISQFWQYIFSYSGNASQLFIGAARIFVMPYHFLSNGFSNVNEERQQVVHQNALEELGTNVVSIGDKDFEARVLSIMKKHYANLSPPADSSIIHFTDETLHNQIFPAISQYFTSNPQFLESTFKKYLIANQIQAAPQIFDIDAKISSIVAKDHKNQRAVVEAAIQKYLSTNVAQIIADYHTTNPGYLAELIKVHFTANPLIKGDELSQKIESIVKNDDVIKIALSEQLNKLQLAVASPSYDKTSSLSVAYLDSRLSELYTLFDAKLRNYSYDRTGEPDFALETSGGFVVSTRCTEEYDLSTRRESIFGIPLWYTQYSPRYVIQRPSANINAGECWAIKGQTAFLVVQLVRPIRISSISYEHLPKALSPDGTIDSAPKKFKIWSLQNEKDNEKFLIGEYYYDENGEALQKFNALSNDPRGTPMVEFELTKNYGAPYTCIYRLRVHGTPLK